ncbi:PREDICTED: protein suppressor of sable isoform X3 [Papilio polytes]|uniref:protein suppressor of sable isoform X3 n=1 Tax=Papilio polytes TaxID=76194 RepID=UPI00067676B9|nr:PREDICTED: protein suppressor of sable isoform X3 [Papilio polytes]
MLIVSTNISVSYTMAETAPTVLAEDLEDGEIESEGEEATENVVTGKSDECNINDEENQDIHKEEQQQFYYSKSGKKKKSKSHKGEQKFKDKSKKNRKYTNPLDDDFAGNIEKAIRKAMNKNEDIQGEVENEAEERRKYKKRKKYDNKDGPGRKRKKQEYSDEMDESEMMCVRGASPVHKNSPGEAYQENDSSYASDSSQESRGPPQHRPQRQRPPQRERNKNNKNDRRRGTHPMQDPEGVCLYYMQGKCQKENTESQERSIPSLFELNIPIPQNSPDSFQMHQYNNERQKVSPKIRQSRWQNEGSNPNFGMNLSPNGNTSSSNILNIKNLTGVLTPKQISDLTKMGIENLDQLGQLTVLQLNSIGISLKQITEIQLNTMSIQKLGLINNVDQQAQAFIGSNAGAQDMDLRVPPVVQVSSNASLSTDLPGQDIDMRFQPSVSLQKTEEIADTREGKSVEQNKDMIDIDQYTKDALKFALKDKENIDISNESFENEKPVPSIESKDVDHRVLPFANDDPRMRHAKIEDKPRQADTDIRFLQPEPIFKNTEKRHRRSTTDDEDNNLLIDEKWYSSDEEKGSKKKSPASSPKTLMSPPAPHIIEPSTVISRLGDLSKIDISEEVTKLLNTMKNNTQDNKQSTAEVSEPRISRDPRSRRSPDRVSDSGKTGKKSPRVSIYECIDGEPTDGRRRTDVDLRQADYKVPTFGDTDLRQSADGDIDFRLGLPFKAIPNYTPASEINGSINSHPPISYKLVTIDIPRPDYTDIRNSTAKSQALQDPRLRKVFRLSVDESNSDSEKPPKVTSTAPRVDPRRKPKEPEIVLEQKTASIDLQTILQNSNWYKDLSSTQKIFVNQHLVPVTQMIKQYQQDKSSGKKFDISSVQSNTVLCNIFTNLGVSLEENGEYSYLPKPKEALLKTPVNFNQGSMPFNMNSAGGMEPNMSMMSVPPMGMGAVSNMNNLNVGHMHNFNQPLSDPRGGPAPGLLGIAPNIPHNFNNNFGGPNNYGNNMSFNGPPQGNDFNYMDGDQNFQRFPNRGGHRGRGNDRWNRGGSGRGHRDRKNYNDRGNWKHDRH